MIETVVALIMFVGAEIKEHRIQANMLRAFGASVMLKDNTHPTSHINA